MGVRDDDQGTPVVGRPGESVEKKIECQVFSRVVGYWAPVRNWNKGKQQEFAERKEYEVPNASN